MLKNKTTFHIKSLNQEKLFNEISKTTNILQINRESKNETTFECSFFDRKKVNKILKDKNVDILSTSQQGFFPKMLSLFKSYGVISAFILFFVLYLFQSSFIWQYQINGSEKIAQTEIVQFVKTNFSRNKNKLDTKNLEVELLQNFQQISFASCMIKGQTLIINLKEKLLPEEMFGKFQPIVSDKYAKIKSIELIAGTLKVKAGDIVKSGDVLVEPYVIDASGEKRQVEPKAKIVAEVYNEGDSEHYAQKIEITRTGKVAEKNIITLFGLDIYSYSDKQEFGLFETEEEVLPLVKNLVLPLKIKKIKLYELEKKVVESDFDSVKDEYVQKARAKALNNCANCDKIIEEFYTVRHISGVTIVNFCAITEEEIGVKDDNRGENFSI